MRSAPVSCAVWTIASPIERARIVAHHDLDAEVRAELAASASEAFGALVLLRQIGVERLGRAGPG